MIGELPLSELPHLLAYADERESEKALTPLWVAHYAVSKLSGKEPVPFESLLSTATESNAGGVPATPKRNPEAIEFDFERVIQRDRERLAKGGVVHG